jgi:hypothetical protein
MCYDALAADRSRMGLAAPSEQLAPVAHGSRGFFVLPLNGLVLPHSNEFRWSSDPIMVTTILAYVIAAVGLATILAGGWNLVMLTIQDYPRGDIDFRDLDFMQYAVAIAMIAGGFAMVGIAQALRLLLLIYHQTPL